MKQLPCEIIQDLLPLYEDDLCSEKSKILIDEHLQECGNCKTCYDRLHGDIPIAVTDEEPLPAPKDSPNASGIRILKRISRRIKRQKFTSCVILFVIITALSILTESDFFDSRWGTIPLFDHRLKPEDLEITELYHLKNGDIYCTLKSDRKMNVFSTSDEIHVPETQADNDFGQGWQVVSASYYFWSEQIHANSSFHEFSVVFHPIETFKNSDGETVTRKSSSIYYEGKHDQKLLIWEEGQAIEAAPDQIEQRVQRERPDNDNTSSLLLFHEDIYQIQKN